MRKTLLRVALLGAAAGGYVSHLRPKHLCFGATEEEVARALPGDDLIRDAKVQSTRAITIDAMPDDVWPWIVQLGQDRGGFYTYDWLENLFGLGIHSTDRILAEWQHRDVGDFVRGGAWGSIGWYVMEVEPPHVLVLQAGDQQTGRPLEPDEPPMGAVTWAFVAGESEDKRTRLIVRARYDYSRWLARAIVEAVEAANFVMTRRMLQGIKDRGERMAAYRTVIQMEGTAA
ncbi:MAG TPA: SRPBCC family protein [Acidimicrobiia bacterium]